MDVCLCCHEILFVPVLDGGRPGQGAGAGGGQGEKRKRVQGHEGLSKLVIGDSEEGRICRTEVVTRGGGVPPR